MKAPVARSKTRLRFILGLKAKSKLSSIFCGSRNSACLRRRSSRRSVRRSSSSETRQEIRSIGAMAWACACCRRVSNTEAMPPSRSCRKARFSSIRFMGRLLGALFNQVAVLREFTNQGIDLAQAEWQLRAVFQIAAHEAEVGRAYFKCRSTGVLGRSYAIFLGYAEQTQNAADGQRTSALIQHRAELAEVETSLVGAREQVLRLWGNALG